MIATNIRHVRDAGCSGSPPPARSVAGRGWGWGWGAKLGTARKPRNPDTRIARARKLRHNTTMAERKLWWHLRRLAPARSHFRRQATIGHYYADFACHDLRLIVEIDGGQHGHSRQRDSDATRTEFLKSRGYRVLRFWNNDVLSNIDGVLTVIQSALDDAAAMRPPPSTPPRHSASLRGGRGQLAAPSPSVMNDDDAAPSIASSAETSSIKTSTAGRHLDVRDASRLDSPPPVKRRGGGGGTGVAAERQSRLGKTGNLGKTSNDI
jgi:very-short-patch-repair endonuclease